MNTFWVADIGGTNCRLALFSEQGQTLSLTHCHWFPTNTIPDAQSLAKAFQTSFAKPPDAIALALAGPVFADRAHLSNGTLSLTADSFLAALSSPSLPLLLLNDFSAQALAIETPCADSVVQLRTGTREASGRKGILGAGTGLGCALLLTKPRVTVLPSEGGHMPFPFMGREELAYQEWLQERIGKQGIEAEDVLSGKGLERLYTWLFAKEALAGEIANECLTTETPLLSFFARLYARFIHMWILSTRCTEGLWVSGGLAQKNPLLVQSKAFFAELERLALPWTGAVPLALLTNENAGLWGAAKALTLL